MQHFSHLVGLNTILVIRYVKTSWVYVISPHYRVWFHKLPIFVIVLAPYYMRFFEVNSQNYCKTA
uniref:Uncharacterized protein n=1 Tax=Trichobilharzia regenti TaxID=157069 RepID=A0AA85J3T2_TRIRE|nr:unnamed protein product [Trichobilharzia regenti]